MNPDPHFACTYRGMAGMPSLGTCICLPQNYDVNEVNFINFSASLLTYMPPPFFFFCYRSPVKSSKHSAILCQSTPAPTGADLLFRVSFTFLKTFYTQNVFGVDHKSSSQS